MFAWTSFPSFSPSTELVLMHLQVLDSGFLATAPSLLIQLMADDSYVQVRTMWNPRCEASVINHSLNLLYINWDSLEAVFWIIPFLGVYSTHFRKPRQLGMVYSCSSPMNEDSPTTIGQFTSQNWENMGIWPLNATVWSQRLWTSFPFPWDSERKWRIYPL